MERTGTASLAAHFRTKRRIFGVPGADSDALVQQAHCELQDKTNASEEPVFRFDFHLKNELHEPKKKRKSKKKKKKGKTTTNSMKSSAHVEVPPEDAVGKLEEATVDHEPQANESAAPVKSTKPNKKSKKKNETMQKAPSHPASQDHASSASLDVVTKDVPPPPSFFKLRKPTSSDSEVMKMQLRYGRGKRNATAIAQRAKQKRAAAENGQAPSSSLTSSPFQFNFF